MSQLDCETAETASCFGPIVPPRAIAECETHARIEGALHATCTTDKGDLHYTLVNTDPDPSFSVWSHDLERRIARLRSLASHAHLVLAEAASVIQASQEAIPARLELAVKGDVDLATAVGLGCAITQLPMVPQVLSERVDVLEPTAARARTVLDRWTTMN